MKLKKSSLKDVFISKRGQIGASPPPIPMPGSRYYGKLPFVIIICFIAIIILEIIGGTPLLIAAIILGVFGFIHLFSGNGIAKFVLGVIPLFLAVLALPEFVGGRGFGDIISKIPLIGMFDPGSFWRYLILAGVFVYYIIFLRSTPNLSGEYTGMGQAAGGVASRGAVAGWKHIGGFSIILFIVAVGVIYGLENYSSVVGIDFAEDYGPFIVSAALFITGIAMLFGRGFALKLMGIIGIILGLAGLHIFIPYADRIFDNNYMAPFLPGEKNYIRYGLIAVVVFYFMFKNKGIWSKPIQ